MRHRIRHAHPDLVYGRDEWVLWLLSLCSSTRIVWESHEAKFPFFARALIERTKKCIVLSEGVRDAYMNHGVPHKYLHVAHDAVDDRFFEPHISRTGARKALGITSELPVVLYAGEFDAWKGISTLFDAAQNQTTFSVVVIGGKGEEVLRYQRLYPTLQFLGRRPYRELHRHLQAADVLVIPNTAKNETSASFTSPLKLFAYMTARVPIVASRIPSITNVIGEGETFFFSPDDPVDLERAIKAALSDPNVAREKAERAYEKSSAYTWRKRARVILNFIAS